MGIQRRWAIKLALEHGNSLSVLFSQLPSLDFGISKFLSNLPIQTAGPPRFEVSLL
jgi:hypothetical protein